MDKLFVKSTAMQDSKIGTERNKRLSVTMQGTACAELSKGGEYRRKGKVTVTHGL